MIDVDLWDRLDAAQKKRHEQQVEDEWERIMKSLQPALVRAANEGIREYSFGFIYEETHKKLQELFAELPKFTLRINPKNTADGTTWTALIKF